MNRDPNKTSIMAQEALDRATNGRPNSNYGTIYRGFLDRGIPERDIIPRVNVLTFHAWKAKSRHVKKGEKGVRIVTYIPLPEKEDKKTGKMVAGGSRPKAATVFHISQTELDTVKA